ncbi:hypothetical protein VCV18_012643 [Metarhizium anisopliae]
MEKKEHICVGLADGDVCEREIRAWSSEPKTNRQHENLSSLIKCVDRRRTGALKPDANATATKTSTPMEEPA